MVAGIDTYSLRRCTTCVGKVHQLSNESLVGWRMT